MPRVKYLTTRKPDERLSALLYGAMKSQGMTQKDLQDRLEVSPNTLRGMLSNPEKMSFHNMKKIARVLGISKDEICTAWVW